MAGGGCIVGSGGAWSGSSESSSSTACRPSFATRAPGSQGSSSSSVTVAASSSSRLGRSAGCWARQRSIRGLMPSGTWERSCWPWTIRSISAVIALLASPNGVLAVAAKVSTEPRQKMSLAAVSTSPRHCSGDMKPGEPTAAPVRVSPSPPASRARAMPKSMTRGPSMVIITFDGLRSRWTRPAA